MNEKKIVDNCIFISELLKFTDQETLATLLRENCYLIDEELSQTIFLFTEQLVNREKVREAKRLQTFNKMLIEGIYTWKKINLSSVEFYKNGNYAKGIQNAKQALTLAKGIWLNDHYNVALSLYNMGLLLQVQGRLAEAEYYFQDSLKMLQRLFKKDDLLTAGNLNGLGNIAEIQGRLIEAESYYHDALEMLQRLFKEDNLNVATSLNNLGHLLKKQGKLTEAEDYYKNAFKMFKKLFKEDDTNVATSLNNIGLLLQVQGRLTEAEVCFQDALEMLQRLFKTDHLNVAISLSNIGLLLQVQGRLTEAGVYFQDALEMLQRLFKTDHPNVAINLNNMGALLEEQNRLTEAESYYQKALEMRQRLFKEAHPDIAISLSNMGTLLSSQNRLTEAESYHQEALEMRQRLFKEAHPDIAISLNNLGYLIEKQGRLTEAESYYKEALRILQRLFKEDHPNIATSLNNLGYLTEKQGRLTEAESYYRNALGMCKRIFEEKHPDVARTLKNLGFFFSYTHHYKEALVNFKEAIEVENRITNLIFSFSSQEDRFRHLKQIEGTKEVLLSSVVTYLSNNLEAIGIAFDIVLQRKSVGAAAIAAFNSVIYEEQYQHLKEDLQKWHSLGEQIVYFTFNQTKSEDRERLVQLTQEADRLEKYLSSQVSEIQLKDKTVDRQAVSKQLPSGSILLEFVRFFLYDFKNRQWNSPCYAVFVIRAGQPDKVEMKVLGEAAEIEELIEYTRLFAIACIRNANGKLQVTRSDGKKLGINSRRVFSTLPQIKPESIPDHHYIPNAAIQLRQKILDPIWDFVKDSEQIFISPDGNLNLLPFGILPLDETGHELFCDRYQISYLSSARDLFRSTVSTNRPASEPLVIADPKFLLEESDSVAISQNNETENQFLSTKLDSQLIDVLDEEHLSRAETTGLLAEKVAAMLGVEPHLQEDALVSHLKRNKCPKILVIGTHGLYCPLSEAQQNAIAHQDRGRLSSLPQVPNPMIRSGLAFAGATNWQKNLPLPPEAGNGYLMAQDVAQLDLWANEITVLLACNSAVGDVHQGEGVFGLRRAFAVAGAKTLIMSLWSVPEKASALLMERFFNNLQEKMARNAALQEAQNYIRFITVEQLRQSDLGLEVLKELTGNRNFDSETLVKDENCQPLKHPFYWGAWICQGETTPLDLEFG